MALVLKGDGVGRGCSVHGTYVWHGGCEECRSLPPMPLTPSTREILTGKYEEMPENDMAPLNPSALNYASKYCRGCCYGSHCLGADPDCECCQKMLLKCPIDGEEYWSDTDCPRTAIHQKI